ncbi:MAG: hypothetical protein EBV06_02005 [Planctomycetia bacterium]|nr:hypothetical protein [Planctomycetia bacterium]
MKLLLNLKGYVMPLGQRFNLRQTFGGFSAQHQSKRSNCFRLSGVRLISEEGKIPTAKKNDSVYPDSRGLQKPQCAAVKNGFSDSPNECIMTRKTIRIKRLRLILFGTC